MTDEYDISELTRQRITSLSGVIIGRTRNDALDVELSEHYDIQFPNMFKAISWTKFQYEHVDLRHPVSGLDAPVVLTARLLSAHREPSRPSPGS